MILYINKCRLWGFLSDCICVAQKKLIIFVIIILVFFYFPWLFFLFSALPLFSGLSISFPKLLLVKQRPRRSFSCFLTTVAFLLLLLLHFTGVAPYFVSLSASTYKRFSYRRSETELLFLLNKGIAWHELPSSSKQSTEALHWSSFGSWFCLFLASEPLLPCRFCKASFLPSRDS